MDGTNSAPPSAAPANDVPDSTGVVAPTKSPWDSGSNNWTKYEQEQREAAAKARDAGERATEEQSNATVTSRTDRDGNHIVERQRLGGPLVRQVNGVTERYDGKSDNDSGTTAAPTEAAGGQSGPDGAKKGEAPRGQQVKAGSAGSDSRNGSAQASGDTGSNQRGYIDLRNPTALVMHTPDGDVPIDGAGKVIKSTPADVEHDIAKMVQRGSATGKQAQAPSNPQDTGSEATSVTADSGRGNKIPGKRPGARDVYALHETQARVDETTQASAAPAGSTNSVAAGNKALTDVAVAMKATKPSSHGMG